MTTITGEFVKKIIAEGGILDTKNYRYVADDYTTVRRMPIEYIGTTAAIDAEWESVTVKD